MREGGTKGREGEKEIGRKRDREGRRSGKGRRNGGKTKGNINLNEYGLLPRCPLLGRLPLSLWLSLLHEGAHVDARFG